MNIDVHVIHTFPIVFKRTLKNNVVNFKRTLFKVQYKQPDIVIAKNECRYLYTNKFCLSQSSK